jgi:hypothetical protein
MIKNSTPRAAARHAQTGRAPEGEGRTPSCARARQPSRRRATSLGTVLLLLGLGLQPAPELRAQAHPREQADFRQLLADKTAPIVTLKFVLKIRSNWGETEAESEATAVIVEPDGLVLCSKTELGGFGGHFGGTRTSMPTDIKVLIGDDTEGLDARLLARDSELDLIWLRIEELGDRKLPYVNLAEHAVPEIGDHLYSVTRMGKYFDRIAVVREGRVGGITAKPRRLYVPSGGGGSLGLPVYNAAGALIGFPIRLRPEREELEGAPDAYSAWGLILPAQDVAKATQRAKEAELDEEQEPDATGSKAND